MLRTILIHSWKILLPLILGAFVYYLPGYIEKEVSRRLNTKDIEEILISTVRSRTGLTLNIEGSRYAFVHGLIFSGITLAAPTGDEAPPAILKAEHIVLSISYYDLWKGRFPLKYASVKKAKFNPWAISSSEWSRIFARLHSVPESGSRDDEIALRIQEGLFTVTSFDFANLEILFPPDIILTIHDRTETPQMLLDAQTRPEKNGFSLKISGVFGIRHHLTGKLDAAGRWTDQDKSLNVNFSSISAAVVSQLLQKLNDSEDTAIFPETSVKEGFLTGTAAAVISNDTVSIQSEGRFSDLDAETEYDDIPYLALNNGSGSYSVTAAFRRQDGTVHKAGFVFEEPHLGIRADYASDDKNRSLRMESRFSFMRDAKANKSSSSEFRFLDLPLEGNIKARYFLNTGRNTKNQVIRPQLEIRTDGLHIDPPQELAAYAALLKNNRSGIAKGIKIDNGFLLVNENGNSEISLQGSLFSGAFRMSAAGQVSFVKERFRDQEELIIKRNYKASAEITDMHYSDLASALLHIPMYIYAKGTDRKAVISEDMGPVWTNRFINTKAYRHLIAPLNFSADIRFYRMQGGRDSLPDLVLMSVQKQDNLFQINIPQAKTAVSEIMLRYRILFDAGLPSHDGEFVYSASVNPLPVPEFFSNHSVPSKMRVRFTYSGQGLLPGDLVNRSYSSFSMEAEGADLSEFDGAKLSSYHFQIPPDQFRSASLKWNRTTEGLTEKYSQITVDTGEITATGSGEFDPSGGGYLRFTLRKKQDPSFVKSIGFKLQPDRRWISSDVQK